MMAGRHTAEGVPAGGKKAFINKSLFIDESQLVNSVKGPEFVESQ